MPSTRHKRILLTLSLSALVILAGCGELGSEAGNPERAGEIRAELNSVSNQLTAVEDRANEIDGGIAAAEKKGVNTTNASRQFSTSAESIAAARTKLNQSEKQLNQTNYSEAEELLSEVREQISTVNATLKSTVESLELSYTVALNDSRSNLQDAYAEYQIAVAYVNDASDEGSTGDLPVRINATSAKIERARQAIVKDRNPAKADRLADQASRASQQIQSAAVQSAKKSIATQAISQVGPQIQSISAKERLEAARTAGDDGNLNAVEAQLTLAQHLERVSRYETYSQAVTMETGLHLQGLNESITQQQRALSNGTVPDSNLGKQVERSRECLTALQQAKNMKRAAMREQAVLIEANFTSVNSNLSAAQSALTSGKYDRACSNAEKAQNESTQIQDHLKTRKANQLFVFNFPNPGSDTSPIEWDIPSIEGISINEINLKYTPPSNITTDELDIDAGSVTLAVADTSQSTTSVEFRVTSEVTEPCGTTCRTTEASLTNVGQSTAHDVSVEVSIYVDKQDGEKVWSETIDIGDVSPGESITQQNDVSVGLLQGNSLKQNGARIVMEITSEEKSVTIEKQQNFS